MDEIVDLVVKKTGISDELARQAVETVIDYLKDKLPDPITIEARNSRVGTVPERNILPTSCLLAKCVESPWPVPRPPR